MEDIEGKQVEDGVQFPLQRSCVIRCQKDEICLCERASHGTHNSYERHE